MAVRLKGLGLQTDLHSGKTSARLLLSAARGVRPIHQNVGVVYIPLVTGTDLNRPRPSGSLDGKTENEVPVGVGSTGREPERLLSRKNKIGFPQLPALHELWRRRQVTRRALDFPLVNPLLKKADLVFAQTRLVGERHLLGIWQPRRHDPAAGDDCNLSGVALYISVGQQRERGSFARAMAAGTRSVALPVQHPG